MIQPTRNAVTENFLKQNSQRLSGRSAAMVVFSQYPFDPRPRRAAEALVEEGMAVDLICEGDPRQDARETMSLLKVSRIPIKHHRGGLLSYAYEYSFFILWSAAILAWRGLHKRYDLIYVHNMPDILVLCALIPRLFGAKVVLDQHDPMPELMMTIFNKPAGSLAVRFICAIEKWSLGQAHRVIVVNEACRKLFSSRGCPADKIGVVMNSPDEKFFSYRAARSYPQRAGNRKFVMMYHGSLVERNGLDLAVAAVARLRETMPNVELRIYGNSTPYLKRVFKQAEEMDLLENIRYLGGKTLEQLAVEIQSCDVGVIPNQRNAFTEINTPTRIFEYLALGKPVVAPHTQGILDYFGPDELIYFAPGDAEGLAAAIGQVAEDWPAAVANAERGQRVYFRHTWQKEREALVRSVCELLGVDSALDVVAVSELEEL